MRKNKRARKLARFFDIMIESTAKTLFTAKPAKKAKNHLKI